MSATKEELDYEPITPYGTKKALTEVISDAMQDTMVLSTKQTLPASSDYKDLSELCEDYNSQTYEDILATAVLNKVFEKCDISTQEFGGAELAAEQGGTDTDSGLSGSLRGDVLKGVFRSASEGLSEESPSPPCHSPKEDYAMTLPSKICGSPPTSLDSPCGDAELEAHPPSLNSPDLWNSEDEDGLPVQFKIEEHIEEITTHHITDEEILSDVEDEVDGEATVSGTDSYHSDAGRNGKPKSTLKKKRFATKTSTEAPQNLLPAFDLPSITGESILDPGRVPFPELGVDLLQGSAATEETGQPELVLENIDWKQNWLFKSEKGKRNRGVKSVDTITMLIPNPSSVIGPTIGDRDVDELSELSDRHSNYSFDMTSSDEEQDAASRHSSEPSKDLLELVGEINAEFAQQDHEYTEHTTGLHRLQIINSKNSPNSESLSFSNSAIIQENCATPVPKPRTHVGKKSTFIKDKSTRICETSSKKGSKTNSLGFRTPVVVLDPPKDVPQAFESISSSSATVWFESTPEDQVVPVGRALRAICQVQAKKICGVSWYYGNELLDSRKDVVKWKKADVYNLNIFEMSDAKAGTYIVGAYTKDDIVWSRFHVSCADQTRVEKIPRITLTLSDVTVEEGGDATLECQIGGHPEPKVTFIKNSVPLSPSPGSCVIENDQYGTWILRLMGVTEEKGGKIKAIASNSLGHAMTSCNIIVVPEGQLHTVHSPITQKTQASKNNKKKKKCSSQTENITSNEMKTNSKSLNACEINNKEMSFQPSLINASNVNQTLTCINNKINQNRSDVSDGSVDGAYDIQGITINGHYFQPPKPGTIAEREHRKWLEAKPLLNNPYSPEKLVHRLGQRPNRFPSLPVVYRDSGEEQLETRLRDELMSSNADLSRYSRDYHVNSVPTSSGRGYKSEDEVSKSQPRPQAGLVRIEPTIASDWKEELKDIKLNVGKKVADIQKTIDAYQHEWGVRLHQKGLNNHISQQRNRTNSKLANQKLSASCINLTSPPKSKPFTSGFKNRHLVYSSTEALNANNTRSEKSRGDIWRTVSVDTLNSPPKFSLMTSNASSDQVDRTRFDSRESIDGHRDHPQHCYLPPPISDSDDSTGPYSQYHNTNGGYKSLHNNYSNQNGYRIMASHYSENSIDSLKEESDTEESYSTIEDNPNLPSVKELASKFDSLKNVKNRSAPSRKSHHEKSLRPSRLKDVVIVEHRDQNGSIMPSYRSSPYHRKHNAKVPINEVHHSLTARSVSRSFREGLRQHNQRRQPSKMETLADESSRFLNQDQDTQATQRDTSSPEHLGIPSSPASIQPRQHYSYPTPGDTSDDSMVAGLTPRKNYRKKNSTGRY